MKKVFTLCLALSILVLSGCGSTQTAEQPAPAEPAEQHEPTEVPEAAAPAPVETEAPH